MCVQMLRVRNAKPLKRRPDPKDVVRFLKFVRVTAAGCWEWTGHKNAKGYGQFHWDGRLHYAHRWAAQTFRGAFPRRITAGHQCRNPSCVNPDHIEPETHAANTADGNAARARRLASVAPF